jgi:hypothetical protein
MDSGWIAFTVLLSVLGVSIMLGLVKSYLFPVATVTQDAFTKMFGGVIGGFLRMSLNVVPITLFTFGFASDLINQEMRMSIPSLSSFLLMILLRVATTVQQMRGSLPSFAPASGADSSSFFCTLPGLEFIENPWFPTSVLSTIVISFYYLFWAAHSGQKLPLIGAITGFAVAASTLQFTLGSCANLYVNLIPSLRGFGVLLPTWIVGLVVAGITYGVVVSAYPTKNPLVNVPGGGPIQTNMSPLGKIIRCPVGSHKTGLDSNGNAICGTPPTACPLNTTWVDADWGIASTDQCIGNSSLPSTHDDPLQSARTSSAPSGGEQTFVAELYKNGQLVSSV